MRNKNIIYSLLFALLFSLNINAQFEIHQISKNDVKFLDSKNETAINFSSKISPALNSFINKVRNSQLNKISLTSFIKKDRLLNAYFQNESLFASVLIKSSDVYSTVNEIEALKGIVNTIAGDIITAEMPLFGIEELSISNNIKYIDGSYKRELLLDESHKVIDADKVHSQLGIKGKDVIVGVVDSGIDWSHPDFSNASGTRIKYIWDQSGFGTPPQGFSYGVEYTKQQIDAGDCNQVDGNDGGGHGTHVAATAAGDDNSLTGYQGIAPESDIVFVKGFREGPYFYDSDVINGVNYIFTKATQTSKPAVANLSLGGHFGPHDGTSLYEQALRNLSGEGKIIVAAAGNEGNDLIHTGFNISGNDFSSSSKTIWSVTEGEDLSVLSGWIDNGNASVGIAVYNKSNGSFIAASQAVNPGNVVSKNFTANGITYGHILIDARNTNDVNNGDAEIYIELDGKGQYNLSDVLWAVYVYGSGYFDGWVAKGGQFTTHTGTNVFPGNNDKSIGIPGTAEKVICVGSFVSKDCWTDNDGSRWCYTSATLGDKSEFSSIGPTRDGRIKPDISAPGQAIGAALSSNMDIGVGVNAQMVLEGEKHQIQQGTSMASPHVAGTVALMLEKNNKLKYEDVLSILTTNTSKDNFTGNTQNNYFGFGKLNAYNSVNATGQGAPQQTTLLKQNFDGNSFPPSNWTQKITNTDNTWIAGNPANNKFNTVDATSVYSALCPWVAQDQDEWLYSPKFSLGNGNANLEFYAGYKTQFLNFATLKLFISTNNGQNWTKLWEAVNDQQNEFKWRKITIDLSIYKNKNDLILGWQYVGNNGDLMGIDNVKVVGYPGTTSIKHNEIEIKDFHLYQNYPNPFNPVTKIKYQIPESGFVQLAIFDLLGQKIKSLVSENQAKGIYTIDFNAEDFVSGVYIYQLSTGTFVQNKKMILVK